MALQHCVAQYIQHVHNVLLSFAFPFQDIFPNQDELYGRQLNEDVWRDGEASSADVPVEHPVMKDDENGVSKGLLTCTNQILFLCLFIICRKAS